MIGVLAGGGPYEFESHIAPQPFVPCPKNLTHSSRADFLQNPVVTYKLASHLQVAPCWHVMSAWILQSIPSQQPPASGTASWLLAASRLGWNAATGGIAPCFNSCSPAYFRGSL